MTFRTRLLVIFTVSVVASVGLVEWLVLANTRQAFERTEAQRVDALVGQFRKEFDRRRDEIAHAVNRIAESDPLHMAVYFYVDVFMIRFAFIHSSILFKWIR